MGALFTNPEALREHISEALHQKSLEGGGFPEDVFLSPVTSSVLFLLGGHCNGSSEPCVVFNKRSLRVRQPGDLCFPGGRVAPRLDFFLSKVLKSPLSPLARWRFWPQWRDHRREQAKRLSLLLATSLRESVEEMRLNPFGVTFLGPMPSEDLFAVSTCSVSYGGLDQSAKAFPAQLGSREDRLCSSQGTSES